MTLKNLSNLKLRGQLGAAQLELLDDVGDLLFAVGVEELAVLALVGFLVLEVLHGVVHAEVLVLLDVAHLRDNWDN